MDPEGEEEWANGMQALGFAPKKKAPDGAEKLEKALGIDNYSELQAVTTKRVEVHLREVQLLTGEVAQFVKQQLKVVAFRGDESVFESRLSGGGLRGRHHEWKNQSFVVEMTGAQAELRLDLQTKLSEAVGSVVISSHLWPSDREFRLDTWVKVRGSASVS